MATEGSDPQGCSSSQSVDKNPKRFLTVGLDVSGLPCLIVGGGRVGGRRALLLAENGAKVTVLSTDITRRVREAVADGSIQWRRGRYVRGAIEGFRLVVAATNDAELNRRIGRDAQAQGTLCCITSAGCSSSVIFPAVYEHEGATVAVHSHGLSVRHSRQIRDTIANALTWGCRAEDKLCREESLQGEQRSPRPGNVYLVGAGPGAADLITVRGLEVMRSADVIIYDRIIGRVFLEELAGIIHGDPCGGECGTAALGCGPRSESRQPQPRAAGPHELSGLGVRPADRAVVWLGAGERGPERQAAINQKMLEAARAGKVVARIKNGDPFVFGRGAEEVRFLADNGIPFELVPGLTSATGVPSAAGYPLTCRAQGRSFAVTSARVAGGGFNEVYPMADSLVVLMAVGLVDRVAARLLEDGWPPDTPAAMIERGTLPEERRLTGSLSRIADLTREAQVTSPAVLVVGAAAANPIPGP